MAATLRYQDLVKGFSINQLAELFEMDRRTVTDRLRQVEPSGIRSSHPIYRLIDASPKLLGVDGESEVKSVRNAAREKDHWDAQLKKQKFEENAGDLWRTDKVIEVFADVFKQFRESVTIFIDSLEHESGLPPETIQAAKGFGDNLLLDCREKLLQLDTGEDSDDEPGDDTLEDDDAFLSDLGLD